MDLNGFALNAMSGGIFSCLITQDRDASNRWAKTRLGFHASDVGMLSLAQELLVNKGAGLLLEFRVFRCYSGHWIHLMEITHIWKKTPPHYRPSKS